MPPVPTPVTSTPHPPRGPRLPVALSLVLVAAVAAGAVGVASALGGDQHGATILRFRLSSRSVHQVLPEVVVIAPGRTTKPRPLLVFLHGKGSDGQDSNLNPQLFAALARQGADAPDIVFPNGGDDSYWHNRATGDWASYVLDEVIPAALRLTHADPHRIAIGGLSMGGFGALDIARLHRQRFCAVGADSAALWSTGADSAPGAFDDAQDFARHDLIAAARHTDPYQGIPVWLDVGSQDPFRASDTTLARELRVDGADVTFTVWPGGHDGAYWAAHWGSYLAFYAHALSRCA